MARIAPTRPRCRRLISGLALACLALVLLALALVTGCQSRLIYFPRPYSPGAAAKWASATSGQAIDFTTSQGRQRAFLQGERHHPRRLWLVCGGNGSVALDWSDWLLAHGPREDAWLLVDFPGYGDCHGSPSPATIRESFHQLVPLAMHQLGWSPDTDAARLRIFGHSLGAAACLIAAADEHIQRGVLLAPFTSTMDMTREVTGLPLGCLLWHRFDNCARLADLARHGPAKITILHGIQDEVIPIPMSRQLAARYPAVVELREIDRASHNTIQQDHAGALAQAIREAGQ